MNERRLKRMSRIRKKLVDRSRVRVAEIAHELGKAQNNLADRRNAREDLSSALLDEETTDGTGMQRYAEFSKMLRGEIDQTQEEITRLEGEKKNASSELTQQSIKHKQVDKLQERYRETERQAEQKKEQSTNDEYGSRGKHNG